MSLAFGPPKRVAIRLEILLVTLAIVASGCAAKTTRNLGAAVALRGQSVADAAVGSYDALEQQQALDKRQQDFIKILTSPNPTAANPDTKAQDFSQQFQARARAYRALRAAYAAFHQLSDRAFGTETASATTALAQSITSLKGISDLPKGVVPLISGLSNLAVQGVQAGEIQKHNRILLGISQAFRTLWEDELPLWQAYLSRIYNDFADPIGSVPTDRFDPKGVSELVKEPFTPVLRIQLYKLQLRDDARRRRDELDARLRDVGRALRLLESAHAELAMTTPSIADVTELVDTIRALIEPLK